MARKKQIQNMLPLPQIHSAGANQIHRFGGFTLFYNPNPNGDDITVKSQTPFYQKNAFYMLVRRGEMDIVVNRHRTHIVAPALVSVQAMCEVTATTSTPTLSYVILQLTPEQRDNTLQLVGMPAIVQRPTYLDTKPLSAYEYAYYDQFFTELTEQFTALDHGFKLQLIQSYINMLFVNLVNAFSADPRPQITTASRQEHTFNTFIELLQQHGRTEREVKFYADRLGITPKYLSAITLTYSDKNASHWISEYVITAAKELIRQHKYKMQEISDMLNFPSQSFFGRYFKRVAGISPKQYSMIERKQEIINP